MKLNSLITSTKAYKIFSADKKNGTLSHATLIVCDDSEMLESYLKVFSKALMCEKEDFCSTCRTCKLIDAKLYEDVKFYPESGKILSKDVDDLVEKSYLKPLEGDKKLFVLNNAQSMNTQSQNKLLKTLEEPPKNTYILLGATSVFTLLPTLLSRVKRLDILPFSEEQLYSALEEDFSDSEKLLSAVKLSGGKVSEAINKYGSDKLAEIEEIVNSVLVDMKSSKDVAVFSSKINKNNVNEIVSALSRKVAEILECKLKGVEENHSGVNLLAENYSVGALLDFSDKLREAEKALYFNGNIQAVVDRLLFGLLEGKYKWSK
ncbi:MAG: hypothetical protein J6Q38_03945 [Clostridia bacterium]|nr:hypothetical protein [Clostridia bacterium]